LPIFTSPLGLSGCESLQSAQFDLSLIAIGQKCLTCHWLKMSHLPLAKMSPLHWPKMSLLPLAKMCHMPLAKNVSPSGESLPLVKNVSPSDESLPLAQNVSPRCESLPLVDTVSGGSGEAGAAHRGHECGQPIHCMHQVPEFILVVSVHLYLTFFCLSIVTYTCTNYLGARNNLGNHSSVQNHPLVSRTVGVGGAGTIGVVMDSSLLPLQIWQIFSNK
jgi:hypothetical protein